MSVMFQFFYLNFLKENKIQYLSPYIVSANAVVKVFSILNLFLK